MPRFAIGDLTIDVDVPPRFACEYTLSGSLLAFDRQSGAKAELSALTLQGASGVDAVRQRAAEGSHALHADRPGFASFFQAPKTWFAGFGRHLLIATLTKPEAFPEFADVLASVAPAHDPFPEGEQVAISALRPSHTRWFEQKRTSLLDAIRWSPELHDAPERLDDFWAELLENPPDDEHLLDTMLSGLAVGFGDLLRRHGFGWCVVKDDWGTSIGTVALPSTAKMVIVPDDFVAKRWEAKPPRFVADALRQIGERASAMKADWEKRTVH